MFWTYSKIFPWKDYFDPETSYSVFNFNNEYHVEEEIMRVSNPGTPVDWLSQKIVTY